ncbi:dehydrogenase with different specificitie [Alternaria alternata]|nr:dehydrogenase with different specificitie [Alternaria alternata]
MFIMPSTISFTPLTLQGKVAIVTGASRGIGAGIALELARRGANVALVYTSPNSEEKAKKIASDISGLGNGSKAHIIRADLKEFEASTTVVASTREAFGDKIDILINNAGVLWANPIGETTLEDYTGMFDINVRAPLFLTKAVVPHLRKPGRIINISSVGSRAGPPNLSIYAASKAAVEGLTRSLAHELGDEGHTVNCVSPGSVESDMLETLPEESRDYVLKGTAVEHRVGTADDIAQVVCWIASEDSKWISGQTISASGGFMML